MGQVLLVRHGQASFGSDDYDVLSEAGWEQGRTLGRWWAERGIVPTSLVRGGMRRHRETVEALADSGGPEVEARGALAPRPPDAEVRVDVRWDEFDHLAVVAAAGDVISTSSTSELDRRGFQAAFERATARWQEGGAGYDETFADFTARVSAALADVVADAGPGRTVAVVTSGGTVAAVCAALTGGDWSAFNTPLVNTSVTRVVVGATGARLLTFNEHPHLPADLLTYR